MGFPKHIYRQASAILSQRKQEAEFKAEEHKRELHSEVPALAEIESQLSDCGRGLIAAVAARGGNARAMVDQLKYRSLALQEKRRQLLNDLGLDESLLIPQYHCPICQDSGFVGIKRCVCMEQLLRELASLELGQTGLENFTFDNFSVDYYSDIPGENGISPRNQMTDIKRFCENYARTFDPANSENLMFCGGTGLGKTHLSLAIAGQVIEGGHGVIYASTQNLMSRLEEEYYSRSYNILSNDEPEQRYLSIVLDCDLLVLDDLGTEILNQFLVSTLYNIINSRLLQNKPTIISTNLLAPEISKRYSSRLVSRLFGSYRTMNFIGKDIRIQKGFLSGV